MRYKIYMYSCRYKINININTNVYSLIIIQDDPLIFPTFNRI